VEQQPIWRRWRWAGGGNTNRNGNHNHYHNHYGELVGSGGARLEMTITRDGVAPENVRDMTTVLPKPPPGYPVQLRLRLEVDLKTVSYRDFLVLRSSGRGGRNRGGLDPACAAPLAIPPALDPASAAPRAISPVMGPVSAAPRALSPVLGPVSAGPRALSPVLDPVSAGPPALSPLRVRSRV
jgi:hypothetical protein